MDKIYIETSIISYLTARSSQDVVTLARQELTREWWEMRRSQFDLYTADIVVGEVSEGDDEAVQRRLSVLTDIEELKTTAKLKI